MVGSTRKTVTVVDTQPKGVKPASVYVTDTINNK